MALDHSRLGLENKFLENKSGRIFCVRQVYFTKSCQQVWGRVNQPFILFIHHIWGETVPIYHTDLGQYIRYFTIFQDKLHSVNVQDDQSWAFSETVQKISKVTYTASRFSQFWQICSASYCRVFEWTLIEVLFNIIKNLLCPFFIFNDFITMCNLKKRLIRLGFWVLLQAMFTNDWKQRALLLKLQDWREY